MTCVWVAMSGGVDSSVAAARLVAAGHDVTGVSMQLLPEGTEEGSCCSTDAIRGAKRVCATLGIAHYTLNMREQFARDVVDPFLDEYAAGRTPNPCIECNDRLKFVELLARARTAGAEMLATGHYARIVSDDVGVPWLSRGIDRTKDQSYFLYRMTADQLEHVCFPVGDASKVEIRAEAAALGLPTATRPDSQEICFVPGDIADFIAERLPGSSVSGPILNEQGGRIGTHRGVAHYTIGQRKGLGLSGGPWYVSAIRSADNVVVVSPAAPSFVRELRLTATVWRSPDTFSAEAQVRYRAEPVPVEISVSGTDRALLLVSRPIPAVAPGQAVVCYAGDRVVGGGVVESCS